MIRKTWTWLLTPPLEGPPVTAAIRLMAGSVFFWEGLLKFVYENQGVGRFTKLGFPFPLFTATFVGWLEIGGGLLLMLGIGTRLVAIPFIVEMLVAMLTTKPRLFLGTSPLPLPPVPPQLGMWAVLHEIRSEYAQVMSCVFLLAAGPGRWSLDAALLAGARRVRYAALRAGDRATAPSAAATSYAAPYPGRNVTPGPGWHDAPKR